ncbi:response regulator [Calothrix sp. NIES-3974]|uniref:response regulator n=1 Tax=Calothrix sp. NIES-3974 TaxID=2005462 RepID=UPI000B5F9D78|nr:response regulator [Calothrix sp. NIES-3974]BAZ04426.1 multi-component transcriptional regulator [Calothrix sp. NIES-3974]
MRILLVEDDECIAKAVEQILKKQRYLVDVAHDGEIGWEFVRTFSYDLILLDVILPKLDGIQLCQRLRADRYQTPVLLLTAQNSHTDKVLGLDAGADDYVVKPFDFSELLARIRVLLRRRNTPIQMVLSWENLRLDPQNCEVAYDGHVLNLTPKEYYLLELFLRNPHSVFSRSEILDHLWSMDEAPKEDTVTAHIKGLRQKLIQVGAPTNFIETVYGLGYRLNPFEDDSRNKVLDKSHEETKKALKIVWEKLKHKNRDRLTMIKQAIASLQREQISRELRLAAREAAHKLAGSLGIFGFHQGSQIAKEIEEILAYSGKINHQQVNYLQLLVKTLQEEMQQPAFRELDQVLCRLVLDEYDKSS